MATGSKTGAGFRSLADQLRSWDDERLTRLLTERPDLTTPAPHDFGQLASRATVRASLSRALDLLTHLELCVLDALLVAGQTTDDELVSIVNAEAPRARAALVRLRDLALAWESTSGLRAVSGAADALGSGPGASGLRPRSSRATSGATVAALIDELSPQAVAMLRHVAEQGGEADPGSARRTVLASDAATPAEELISRALLVPGPSGPTMVVPGEVGLALRGGRTTLSPIDAEPDPATTERPIALIDKVAAGAAFDAVRRVELLLDLWGAHPPAMLRNGGLGVRDLKAAAEHLMVSNEAAALLIETAAAAGLLASRADDSGEPVWVPTDAFDAWSGQSTAERWSRLARAWLENPRTVGLVGTRDQAGKAWNALAPDLPALGAAEARTMALQALAELPAGTTLAAGTGLPSLVEIVRWRRPRRPRTRDLLIAHAVAEAAALGVTGLDGVPGFARVLIAGEDPAPVLADLMPAPVDHVLLQADLTAVAPGPLETDLARRLAQVADVESRGGATVYRFTSGSVRRALDVGWAAAELHEFVAGVSRTPVPQPLTYLIDDTVRTFGTVRVGHAEAFLRADDEAALSELLHHPKASGLGLRRIAPTVLISTVPIEVLLPRLRELGAAPVVEAADGSVQVSRPDQLRARVPKATRRAMERARGGARVAAVLTAVRAGDRASAARPATAALSPSGALAALREAIEAQATVVIGYVDDQGVNADRVVDPRSIDGGRLTAFDHRVDDERTFAVHRITTVRPA